MRYVDYKDAIQTELQRNAAGLTWVELQSRLGLPYNRPCPSWTQRLEKDIGLRRGKGGGRSLVWKVPAVAVGGLAARR
jgi:hypothetical protein